MLARHARAYGSREAVAAALPVTLTGTFASDGRTGELETLLAAGGHRAQSRGGGIFEASGMEGATVWSLDAASGQVERLTKQEAIEAMLEAWVLRRGYLADFEAARDLSRCVDPEPGQPGQPGSPLSSRLAIALNRPDLGTPVLGFDLGTAALMTVAHDQPDGRTAQDDYLAWSDPVAGVRWPSKVNHSSPGGLTRMEMAAPKRGLTCAGDDASGRATTLQGGMCLVPPPSRFALAWPTDGKVTIPFSYVGNEILVRARLGPREVWAILDSGAGATAVDAGTEAGAAFTPSTDLDASGATQKVRVGYGELPAIEIAGQSAGRPWEAGVRATRVPTISVPIPLLDAFGDKRPELILGYSFFAAAVVRVDYVKSTLTFARTSDGLFAGKTPPRSVPMWVLMNKIVVDGKVEGLAAPFQVDTGNAGGLDLYAKWAAKHDLPGKRDVVELRGRFGVGTGETVATFYQLGKASLGPIRFDDRLTHVGDPPSQGIVAGLAGNEVLSRCDAVTIDVPKRTLWLEGTCEREVPERKAGWRFDRRPDATFSAQPWVISTLWPRGAADRAGLQVGDRVLEVGGKRATLAVSEIWAMETAPDGTRLPVTVDRAGARKKVILDLRTLRP